MFQSTTPTGRHSDRHERKLLSIDSIRPNDSGSASLSRGDRRLDEICLRGHHRASASTEPPEGRPTGGPPHRLAMNPRQSARELSGQRARARRSPALLVAWLPTRSRRWAAPPMGSLPALGAVAGVADPGWLTRTTGRQPAGLSQRVQQIHERRHARNGHEHDYRHHGSQRDDPDTDRHRLDT